MNVVPYGDRALLVRPEDGEQLDDVVRTLSIRYGELDVVPGASSVAVIGISPTAEACAETAGLAVERRAANRGTAKIHEIPIRYDGPDIDAVAQAAGKSTDWVAHAHANGSYRVALVGFLPGFAYMEGLEPALIQPRRPTPRPRVAARSVGIAGPYTGVYPFTSPGGWNLIGTAGGPPLFDPYREPATRFRAGDVVRFRPDAFAQPNASKPVPEHVRPTTGLAIERIAPGTSIQDLGRSAAVGRPGMRRQGLPASGPWDLARFLLAAQAVGNPASCAALEIPLAAARLRAHGRALVVSVDGEPPMRLAPGDVLDIEPGEHAVRYVAVQGGIDVPTMLGSRSTLAMAGIGVIRPGDLLEVGTERSEVGACVPPMAEGEVVSLDARAGPHVDRFDPDALAVLASATFAVSPQSNRVGTRLEGATIPRQQVDSAPPEPMVVGAVQIATDGMPIVLGPDSAVTGGYPVLATLTRYATSMLGSLRPGRRVRFHLLE